MGYPSTLVSVSLLVALLVTAFAPYLSPSPLMSNDVAVTGQASPAPISFSTPTIVDGSRFTGEPTLHIDERSGTIWVTGVHNNPLGVWESTDGGKTFSYVALPYGPKPDAGADGDAITDGAGRVHIVDQAGLECLYYSRSLDGGRTFTTTTSFGNGTWVSGATGCSGSYDVHNVDRPWLASYRNSTVYIDYGCATGLCLDASDDGGQTFRHLPAIGSSECQCVGGQAGTMTVDQNDGTIYLTYMIGGTTGALGFSPSIKVAVSTDGGNSFQYHAVAGRQGTGVMWGGWPWVAADTSGNVYVSWSDNSTGAFKVYFSASKDRGSTWSGPVLVNMEGGIHWKPVLVAGASGKVAVSWWGTTSNYSAPWLAVNSTWCTYVAVSVDALDPTPQFDEVKVSDSPFAAGPLCPHAPTCAEGGSGLVKDFFEIALDNTGAITVVWPNTALYNNTEVHALFAKEASGPNLLEPSNSTITMTTTSTATSTTSTTTTSSSTPTSSTGGYAVSFTESGLPQGIPWSVYLNQVNKTSANSTITFRESPGSYQFIVTPPTDYTVNPSAGFQTITDTDVLIPVRFAPVVVATTTSTASTTLGTTTPTSATSTSQQSTSTETIRQATSTTATTSQSSQAQQTITLAEMAIAIAIAVAGISIGLGLRRRG